MPSKQVSEVISVISRDVLKLEADNDQIGYSYWVRRFYTANKVDKLLLANSKKSPVSQDNFPYTSNSLPGLSPLDKVGIRARIL